MSQLNDPWPEIIEDIRSHTGCSFQPQAPTHVGGGCVNTSVKLSDGDDSYFVKLNSAHLADMFSAEADGLRELAVEDGIRVPAPICQGISGSQAYLVLEYIALGSAGRDSAATAGRLLARLHAKTQSRFGWFRDNTIGSIEQPNAPLDDWVSFWRERRLGHQLQLAARNGAGGGLLTSGERLLDALPKLLDHSPQPALLHGDLWGGNMSYDQDGRPVIYDPAVYYGDREADLAMTELFGGFPSHFYDAYEEAWPLPAGYRHRKTLYNLYHILNHYNMFGGGYLSQARGMTERLLAEFG